MRKPFFQAVLASILIVAAVLGSFFYSSWFGDKVPPIVLPDEQTDIPNTDFEENFAPQDVFPTMIPLEVDDKNVGDVLASMRSQESYQASYSVTWYWQGGASSSKEFYIYARAGMLRLTSGDENYLSDGENYYHWNTAGELYSAKHTEGMSMSAWAHIPTYESLPEQDNLVGAAYASGDDGSFIVVETIEPVYSCVYWISTETKFLDRAEFRDSGELAIVFQTISFQNSEPDASLFVLPVFAG